MVFRRKFKLKFEKNIYNENINLASRKYFKTLSVLFKQFIDTLNHLQKVSNNQISTIFVSGNRQFLEIEQRKFAFSEIHGPLGNEARGKIRKCCRQ